MWKLLKFELPDNFENNKEKLVILGTGILFCYFMGWTSLFSSMLDPFLSLICIFCLWIFPYCYMFFGKGSPASVFYALGEQKENLFPVSGWRVFFVKSLSLLIVYQCFIWIANILFWGLACSGNWINTNFEWFIETVFLSHRLSKAGDLFSDADFLDKFVFLWKNKYGTGIFGFIDNFPLSLFLQINLTGLVYGLFYCYLNKKKRFITAILSFTVSIGMILLINSLGNFVHKAGPDAGRILDLLLSGGLAVSVVYLEGRLFEKRFRS